MPNGEKYALFFCFFLLASENLFGSNLKNKLETVSVSLWSFEDFPLDSLVRLREDAGVLERDADGVDDRRAGRDDVLADAHLAALVDARAERGGDAAAERLVQDLGRVPAGKGGNGLTTVGR